MLRYTEHKLDNDQRPKYTYDYWVTGHGVFPTDMLRYDRCWPCSSDDAVMMDFARERRSVHLRSYQMPTEGRWASFMWSVGKENLK